MMVEIPEAEVERILRTRFELLPVNLAELGVKRRVAAPEPDLHTCWKTPFPVLKPYKRLCFDLGWKLYGGGNISEQGNGPGRITSGFRSEIINGNVHSPHRLGFALDIAPEPDEYNVYLAGLQATHYYQRVGIYFDKLFIHVDQAPDIWIAKHNKARFWILYGGKTTFYQTGHEFKLNAQSLVETGEWL